MSENFIKVALAIIEEMWPKKGIYYCRGYFVQILNSFEIPLKI